MPEDVAATSDDRTATAAPDARADQPGVTDAVRAQLLATEHWSLLSTRSMTWNETFTRAAMFFTVVSAAVVALALVAQATNFSGNFRLFAIPLLAVVLFVGLGTFSALEGAAAADVWLVAGMNRLRHAYLDLAPELEPYFVAGHHDDQDTVRETSFAGAPGGSRRFLASTPVLVGAISAVVAGALAGLLVDAAGVPVAVATGAGVGVGLAVMVLAAFRMRRARDQFWRFYQPRFPR